VPLLIRAPDLTPGRVDDRNASTIDVLPTIAELLGVEPSWHLDGRSLLDPSGRTSDRKTMYLMPAENGTDERTELVVSSSEGLAALLDRSVEELSPQEIERGAWASPHAARDLVGAPVGSVSTSPAGEASLDEGLVDADGGLPALVTGHVDLPGLDDATVAVAIEGTIAAVAPVEAWAGDPGFFAALIPDRYLGARSSDVTLYLVEEASDGSMALRPLRGS
jgi:hypothetical protein